MLFNRKAARRGTPPAAGPPAPAPPPLRGTAPARQAAPPAPAATDIAHAGDLDIPGRSDAAAPTQSYIDAALTIVGDLLTEGDVRLDGHVCGNVRCAQLIVGKNAAVTGSVVANEAIIRGRLTGTIRANAVIIQGSAQVESEITYGVLAIDNGSSFEGIARRSDSPLSEPERRPLADLQQMTHDATAAGAAPEGEANPMPDPIPAALPAPVANGHDRTTSDHDRADEGR